MPSLTEEELTAKLNDIVRDDPRMILAFKSSIVSEELWELAVSMMPELFVYCKRKTYRITVAAITADGFHLGNVDPLNFTVDQYTKLCELAVTQNPKAIAAVPKEFRSEKLVSYAMSQDPELLLQRKQLTPDMVEAIIEHNPSLIQYVVDPTDDMIIRALKKDPRVIVHCPFISRKVRDFYEETYPQYAAMLIHV